MKRLILSDIHANIEAFKAVLNDAGSFDEIVFLGDLANFGPSPIECLELLKTQKAVCIIGNHDEQIVSPKPKNVWDEWAKNKLSKEQLEWLASFSEYEILDGHILALHGSYAVDYDILPNTPDEDIEKAFKPYMKPNIDEVWFGHYHYQLDRKINGVTYRCIRPVGHHRDKDNRAGYTIYEDGIVTHKRVIYNIEKTIDDLDKNVDAAVLGTQDKKELFLNFVKNAFCEILLKKDIETMKKNEELL